MAKRWNERINDYKNALEKLEEAINDSKQLELSSIKDGVIQRFEFSLELAWKLIKHYLNYEGITEAKSPRSSIRYGAENEIITNSHIWIEMIEDRNLTTHTYSQTTAEEIYEKIVEKYYDELKTLYEKMKNKEVE